VAGRDVIAMSGEELRRAKVIHGVLGRVISQKKAAEVLGICYRQAKRLVARVRQEGDKGLIHRLRARPGNRRIREAVRARALRLHRERYWDFGPTLASEKLCELHRIRLDHDTLRRWLSHEGRWQWQRKGRPHRRRRERKEYFGEMVQMDGSHHDWLEGRGAELVLMGYIDDATGTVFARFYDYEGTMPALDSFWRYSQSYGLPQSIYLDRHTTYKSPGKPTIEDELRGEEPLSQFGRAMKELGVKLIPAYSPQAKGRIERVFGTFQDRVVKEMRLRGISTIEEANKFLESYLPGYNRRFGVPAAKRGDLHREPPSKEELKKILCAKTKRAVANDGVIRHDNRFYQIEGLPTRRTRAVIVEEHLDGSMHVRNNGTYLKYKEIDVRMPRKAEEPGQEVTRERRLRDPRKGHTPPEGHPWRRFRMNTST